MSEIRNCPILVRGGGSTFLRNIWNSPNWDIIPNFLDFLFWWLPLVCELVFLIHRMQKKPIKTKFSFVYKTILNSQITFLLPNILLSISTVNPGPPIFIFPPLDKSSDPTTSLNNSYFWYNHFENCLKESKFWLLEKN